MECKNCKREDYNFVRGYCTKCYPLILRIDKLKTGNDIYNLFKRSNYMKERRKEMLSECIGQIKVRLKDIKDSNIPKDCISAHELESQINRTLRVVGKKSVSKYGLGKINDLLEFNLKQEGQKEFLYQLFAKIIILSRFQIDYWKVYEK